MSLKKIISLNRSYAEWFVAIILSLLTAGCLWWYLVSFRSEQSLQMAVTTQKDLPIRHALTAEDVALTPMPAKLIPPSAIRTTTVLIGQTLTHSLSRGEILVKNDFVTERDPTSEAGLIPEGQMGLVLPSNWLSAPLPRVKKNDLVTIYIAALSPANPMRNNGILIKSAPVLAVNAAKDGAPESIFLALSSDSVSALLQARASQFHLLVAADSGNTRPTKPTTDTFSISPVTSSPR